MTGPTLLALVAAPALAAGALPAAGDAAPEPPPAAADPPAPAVHLVYTGALGGIGSAHWPLGIALALLDADERLDGRLARLELRHGALGRGDVVLLSADGSVAPLVSALGADRPPACAAPELHEVLRTDSDLLVLPEGAPRALREALLRGGARAERRAIRRCTGAGGEDLVLLAPEGTEPPLDRPLEDWEFLRALHGAWVEPDGAELALLGVAWPWEDAARAEGAARRLLDGDPSAIYVDAGDFLDGASSVADGALSLHRPLGFRLLEALRPAALGLGERELMAGLAAFEAERPADLPYVATNLARRAEPGEDAAAAAADDPCASPRHPLPRCRVVEVEAAPGVRARVAFLGLVDPALARRVPGLAREGLVVEDPVAAANEVAAALHASKAPPAVVVALTTASGEVLAELRRGLRGVDLLLGDPTFATLRVERRDVDLRAVDPGAEAAPVTLSLDDLADARLELDADARRLVRVEQRVVPLSPALPPDPDVVAAATRTRAAVYPPLDRPLVPAADPEHPARPWPADRWNALVCEAVREATDADVVLLRRLPAPGRVPGPLTALLVADQLAALDRLEVARVPGDRLGRLLDRAWGVVPVVCGADAEHPKPRGRAIDAARTYRVVTTDRTREGTAVGGLLSGLSRAGVLDPPALEPVPAPGGGGAWTLRSAVLSALEARRAAGVAPEPFEADPHPFPPEWLLRLREARLSTQRFRGTGEEAFAAVPETVATSPSSFTIAAAGDFALERSGPDTLWDLRARGEFEQLRTAEDEQEVADDWKLSTSLAVPALTVWRTGQVGWSPFGELLYDSEFTPTTDEDGAENPRQADLSATVGLSASRSGPLQLLRVGAFVNRDLSRARAPEAGGRLELETSVRLGPWVRWTGGAEAWVWADTPDDDASDLRFLARARTGLALPLARGLSVGLDAEGAALQGRVPDNDVLGVAWTLGASLSAAGVRPL